MIRTIKYVGAISLALMSSGVGTLQASAETYPKVPSAASAQSGSQELDQGFLGQLTERAANSPARSLAEEIDLVVALSLGPPSDRMTRPSGSMLRPRTRPTEALLRPHVRPGDLLLPDPPRTLAGASDLLCMAVAIYHEARNQPLDGQLAVASVILNRTDVPKRWGDTPCEVVLTPSQFSFLTGETTFPPIEEPEAWAVAVEMAREALERGPSPVVGPADHYHTPAVHPDWDENMVRVIRIDDHIFYNDPMARG